MSMIYRIVSILVLWALLTQASWSGEKGAAITLQEKDRIIFLGDSITQMGARPGGYVSLIDEALQDAFPTLGIEVVGAGVGGNRVPNLLRRLERDVLSQSPDVVVVYIGINDVWHWTKPHPVTKKARKGTTAEDYEAGLRDIVAQIKGVKAEVVLCTPTVISEAADKASLDYQRLEAYAKIVRQLASELNCGLIDLRKVFIDYLEKHNSKGLRKGLLTKDGVHMNDAGNVLLAETIGTALGLHGLVRDESLSTDMDLYLLIGQSNMAGRAEISQKFRGRLTNCFLFNDMGEWEVATNPLNRFSSIRKDLKMQKLGLGYSFAKAMHEAKPTTSIGLIVNAKGGAGIKSWQKGSRFYGEALARVKAALAEGRLKAILWHQGEANCNDTDYLPQLIQMISDFRADLNRPELPFIVGQITGDFPVNAQLMDLPNHLPFTFCVSSEGLTRRDKWHFDTEGQVLLGQRYAEAVLRL